ncbi:MAG: 2-phospho-L-lactate transferase [Actinomycetota bacterium]
MEITAIAGGVGAGKFLRGVDRAFPGALRTVVVNTGDDIEVFGLHVSPDLDSVCYWLAGLMDRERGWGRADETFHAMEALRANGSIDAWFNLGDRDLATHLARTALLREGRTLSEATGELLRTLFDLAVDVRPMTDDAVTTHIDVFDDDGGLLDLHFQEYWVRRHAADPVKAIRFEGIEASAPAPGVLEAISHADVLLLCPSNPVVSIGPVLSVPGVRDAVAARSGAVVGVSPIVGGAPLAGMADKLMPVAGLEVSASGAARAYRDLLTGWVIDERDRDLAPRIASELGVAVVVAETVMVDDEVAAGVARAAIALASR